MAQSFTITTTCIYKQGEFLFHADLRYDPIHKMDIKKILTEVKA